MPRRTEADIREVYQVILRLRTLEECELFFRDLLTDTEITEMAERWQAACLLENGVPYLEIRARTGLSTRTIARVHKWLTEGSGGYRLMIKRTGRSRRPSPPQRKPVHKKAQEKERLS